MKIALAAGLTLLAIAIVLTLARSPLSVARTSVIAGAKKNRSPAHRSATYCQSHERLPRGTSAIRSGSTPPPARSVNVEVSAGGRHDRQRRTWLGLDRQGLSPSPCKPLAHTVSDATVCTSVSRPRRNGDRDAAAAARALRGTRRLAGAGRQDVDRIPAPGHAHVGVAEFAVDRATWASAGPVPVPWSWCSRSALLAPSPCSPRAWCSRSIA